VSRDIRRGTFDAAYRVVAAAPYDQRLWDEPDEATFLDRSRRSQGGLAPVPAGYPNPDSWNRFAKKRRMQELGCVVTLGAASKFPLLHSSAPTPFVFHGLRCASLSAFYYALQIPDDDQRRAFAVEPFDLRLRPAPRFQYRDEWIDVWSIDHDALIAGAVEAKVLQNPDVRRELALTERLPIFIGEHFMDRRFDEPRGGLWRAMPLALMLVRARL
jgi:hypothetical protein